MSDDAVSSTFLLFSLWQRSTIILKCVFVCVRVCVAMWQVGVVAERDTCTLWHTPAPGLLPPPTSSSDRSKGKFSNSLYALLQFFFCFFFKHQQDAGKSKVKTRFMFELSKYFQLNRSWLLVEQHNASLCRCQNWCFSVWCHDLNLQIKTDNMFCHGAIFRACGEKKSLHTERRNPAEDSFLFLLVDCS